MTWFTHAVQWGALLTSRSRITLLLLVAGHKQCDLESVCIYMFALKYIMRRACIYCLVLLSGEVMLGCCGG
jgi:hypothetical protein